MEWSPQQEQALKAVKEFLTDPSRQVFRLDGLAGTGKTTLALEIRNMVNGTVNFAAYTGKAASVLQSKGCTGASTIHKLIYIPRDKARAQLMELEEDLVRLRHELRSEGYTEEQILEAENVKTLVDRIRQENTELAEPSFKLNYESDIRFSKLIIIDECSMVDERIGEDLLSFGTKVLVLGDPGQLPPVKGTGFFINPHRPPDFTLTEIHRQARDNPIIDLAWRVRNKEPLEVGDYGDSKVVWKSDFDPAEAQQCDQILVGKNATRTAYNNRMRKILGHVENYPVKSDKIVCLRNNHEAGLLNGTVWEVIDTGELTEDRVVMTISPFASGQDGVAQTVNAHLHHFQGRSDELAWYEYKEADQFDYGYALTVHKAQGSQWDHVVLFDESGVFRNDKYHWLYTGITRAAEKLTIVK